LRKRERKYENSWISKTNIKQKAARGVGQAQAQAHGKLA